MTTLSRTLARILMALAACLAVEPASADAPGPIVRWESPSSFHKN